MRANAALPAPSVRPHQKAGAADNGTAQRTRLAECTRAVPAMITFALPAGANASLGAGVADDRVICCTATSCESIFSDVCTQTVSPRRRTLQRNSRQTS